MHLKQIKIKMKNNMEIHKWKEKMKNNTHKNWAVRL